MLVVPVMSKGVALFDYTSRKGGLVACPFCREMFQEGEAAQCPVCGMALQALEKLPPSPEQEVDPLAPPREPEYETLPFTYLGRNRAALLAVAAAGLAVFFLRWAVDITGGDLTPLTGVTLANGWKVLWIVPVAWFMIVPAVLSRRSIMKMRGARVAVASLAAMPGILVGSLLIHRPEGDAWYAVRIGWPIYATIALSILGILLAVRFGGSIDAPKPAPAPRAKSGGP
jgi:hypothetical protein